MNPAYDFRGHVALVTGASSGIGLTTAQAFAQAGAAVVQRRSSVDSPGATSARRRSATSTPSAGGCDSRPSSLTRPRDLRSSYVTLRIYEGIPLTQIAREVGTSVRMIELHYAGVIANWDGKQTLLRRTSRAARQTSGRGEDAQAN
jgi:NAD(P)-dependent dehydrogenase (short-subunit alcohol dehydrogenase family)